MQNSKRNKVFLDYDSVLVDFCTPWVEWMNANVGPIELEEIVSWTYARDKYGKQTDWWWAEQHDVYQTSIKPFPQALEFVAYLRVYYDVTIVTTSSKISEISKQKQIDDLFKLPTIHTREKHPFTKEGVLIDDNPANVFAHIANNKMPGIVLNLDDKHPYSRVAKGSDVAFYATKYAHVIKMLKGCF